MASPSPADGYEIGAYYFPNYHVEPVNEAVHGTGWTEWELVRSATPRFPGHAQPKVPLWGYEDEADPGVMARKIDAAADHGIGHFLFDWYWYEGRPFLQRALDDGFLGAPNCHRLRFALMWANHHWVDLFPARTSVPRRLLHEGTVDERTFREATDHVIEHYFKHPSYWKIDGCPYFSIYELTTLINGLGGMDTTRAALEDFRARTRAAGLPGLHLNGVVWGVKILPTENVIKHPNDLLTALGFDSISSYVWIHHDELPHFPATSYELLAGKAAASWERLADEFTLPYHPNVTMGWDASPRTAVEGDFVNRGYPFMATLEGNTPQQFRQALERVKDFLDRRGSPQKIFSINAWNEWTEGSYLEPDTVHGLGYLEAIRNVFGAGVR